MNTISNKLTKQFQNYYTWCFNSSLIIHRWRSRAAEQPWWLTAKLKRASAKDRRPMRNKLILGLTIQAIAVILNSYRTSCFATTKITNNICPWPCIWSTRLITCCQVSADQASSQLLLWPCAPTKDSSSQLQYASKPWDMSLHTKQRYQGTQLAFQINI